LNSRFPELVKVTLPVESMISLLLDTEVNVINNHCSSLVSIADEPFGEFDLKSSFEIWGSVGHFRFAFDQTSSRSTAFITYHIIFQQKAVQLVRYPLRMIDEWGDESLRRRESVVIELPSDSTRNREYITTVMHSTSQPESGERVITDRRANDGQPASER
jgi:hypothetical protein